MKEKIETRFFNAIRNLDDTPETLRAITSILEEGCNPNTTEGGFKESNFSAIGYVAKMGAEGYGITHDTTLAAVNTLLSYGAEINYEDFANIQRCSAFSHLVTLSTLADEQLIAQYEDFSQSMPGITRNKAQPASLPKFIALPANENGNILHRMEDPENPGFPIKTLAEKQALADAKAQANKEREAEAQQIDSQARARIAQSLAENPNFIASILAEMDPALQPEAVFASLSQSPTSTRTSHAGQSWAQAHLAADKAPPSPDRERK